MGKTYSTLRWAKEDYDARKKGFVLLRRTDEERQLGALFNPFDQLNRDKSWMVCTDSIGKKVTGFYNGILSEDGIKPQGEPIGYLLALSTIAGVRGLGLNMDSVDKIVFDEFIPESHVKAIKNEGLATLNAYETINRNREMLGRNPVKMIFLANANSLTNPLFITLGIVKDVERMMAAGKHSIIDKDRSLAIFALEDAELASAKKQSALYRLAGDSDFTSMALSNEFAFDDFSQIRSMSIRGARPVYQIGSKCHCWRDPANNMIVSYAGGSFAYAYDPKNHADVLLGRQRHATRARADYAQGRTIFESFELKDQWLDFFGLK